MEEGAALKGPGGATRAQGAPQEPRGGHKGPVRVERALGPGIYIYIYVYIYGGVYILYL